MVGRRVRSVKATQLADRRRLSAIRLPEKRRDQLELVGKNEQVRAEKKIQELLKSDGWGILSQKMQEEILSAAYQMAENKMLTIDEINFRRGAMFAARRLMELPTNLDMLLDNEILMESSEAELKQQ